MTALAVDATKRDDVRALAKRFSSPRSLAAWIRALPQRDDDGKATDGPRIACDVTQRVRIGAEDPNCFERSLLYVAAAELLDAEAVRSFATIETPMGRHTFPVENGRPVVLDPNVRRNQLGAGLWLMQATQRNALPVGQPGELLAWLADIAEEPAEDLDGAEGRARVSRGRAALARALDGAQLPAGQVDDVLYLLDAATEASELYGRAGRYGAQLARAALARVGIGGRRNDCECGPRNVRVFGYDVRPDWNKVGEVATTTGHLGGKAVATYYGGPLAGSLWDPAFQSATGKTPKQAMAPFVGSGGSASQTTSGAATAAAPETKSSTTTDQLTTFAAFALRR